MQMENVRRSNVARTEEMRERLLSAGRELFVSKGFADTSTPAIVAKAGVTRGALYHHFPDKKALFSAVLEAEFKAVATEIARADDDSLEPIDQFLEGAKAYFAAMSRPGRTQLALIDGPAVLGPAAVAALEAPHSEASLAQGVSAALDAGQLPDLPQKMLTVLLSAMFEKAAIEVAGGAPDHEALTVIEALLRGLSTRSSRNADSSSL
jgi:AcrR family transcriptional regulator